MSSKLPSKPNILIVTVTKVESEAVLQTFQEATGQQAKDELKNNLVYKYLGEIKGAKVFMALSEMGASGPGASHATVRNGIVALQPGAVIMVGIAFGVDKKKQEIGDILVSRQLMLYEPQRVGAGEIRPRGDRVHASSWLVNRLRQAELSWHNGGAKVRFGLVLTGEKLIDNVDYRESLKTLEPETIGGEMEGAGLYVPCQEAKVDWILVKAICDWADGYKDQDKEVQQGKAAKNAADFVLHALQLVEWDPPPPPPLPPNMKLLALVMLIVVLLWYFYPNPDPIPVPPMVPLTGGLHIMNNTDSPDDEKSGKITISPFSIGLSEVSREEYARFMAEAHPELSTEVKKHFDRDSKDGKRAMSFIAYTEVQQYLCWLNAKLNPSLPYRLPTEAEWEYADNLMNNDSTHFKQFHIDNMRNGVSEWTCSGPATPEKCGVDKAKHVFRGRADGENKPARGSSEPSARSNDLGFRLAQGSAVSGPSDCPSH